MRQIQETRDPRPLAILIMGPTASGKTDLAVGLVEQLPCEIVSVDSAMIYRGMDIGTAKPDRATLDRAPHRLIDILDPSESYSTAAFREDALRAMEEISAAGHIPLLVGGTMLYFRALQQGLATLPSADPETRQRLMDEAAHLGWSVMHERLRAVDPASASQIHPNDPQRIQRALEVHRLTGRAMSDLIREAAESEPFPYRVLKLVRCPSERSTLHLRIERRFRSMVDEGLVEEVETLWRRGDLHEDLPSMRCVGYRQVLKYLSGEYNWDEMLHRGIVASRQLAKRQLTWLRAERDSHWLDEGEDPLARSMHLWSIFAEDRGSSRLLAASRADCK